MEMVRHQAIGVDRKPPVTTEPDEGVEDWLGMDGIGKDRVASLNAVGDGVDSCGIGIVESLKAIYSSGEPGGVVSH
jgi:hypothetical protein